MSRTLVLTLILLLKAFSASAQNIGDEEARRIFRQFLVSPYETALADRAIEMARRDGNTTLARKLRFEAVDRLLKEPPCKERTEQLEKLLIEIPSRTWTEAEIQLLKQTKIAVPKTAAVLLDAQDTFESISKELQELDQGQVLRRQVLIQKLGLLGDPRAVGTLIHEYEVNLSNGIGTEEDSEIIIESLAKIGGTRTNEFLMFIVNSNGQRPGFNAALNILMKNRSPLLMAQFKDPVSTLLRSWSPAKRQIAAQIIIETQNPKHIELLFKRFKNLLDQGVYDLLEYEELNLLVLVLGHTGDPRALELLKTLNTRFKNRELSALERSLRVHTTIALGLFREATARELLTFYSHPFGLSLIAKAIARIYANSPNSASILKVRKMLLTKPSGSQIPLSSVDDAMAEFGKEREAKELRIARAQAKHPPNLLRNLPEAVRKAIDPKSQSLGAGTSIDPSSLERLNREHDKADSATGNKEETREKKKHKSK